MIGAAFLAMFGAPAAVAWAGQSLTFHDTTSLIQDINTANQGNGANGTDTITFSGTQPTTLQFGGSQTLPSITVPVDLRGNGLVTLSDTVTTSGSNLLQLNAGTPASGAPGANNSKVSGFVFTGATGAGILLGSSNDAITADTFTLNGDGVGLFNGAANNTIGGANGNLITGNVAGVLLIGNGTSGNVLAGNFVGTDASGSGGLGNGTGVAIEGGATNNTIGGVGGLNIISGNTGNGVLVSGGTTTGNVVDGNFIGTDANGSNALGNSGAGVALAGGTTSETITSNLISGNQGDGVQLGGDGNQVAGNYIGTDASGKRALGNGNDGVLVSGANNTLSANVISGNAYNGVTLVSEGNLLVNNNIGTDPGVDVALPNGQQAVQFPTASGSPNTFNTLNGGAVWAGNSTVAIAAGSSTHARPDTLIGGFSSLITSAANMTATTGAPTSTPGAGTTYPVTITGGQPNDAVTVYLYGHTCDGSVAKLTYAGIGTVQLDQSGKGTGDAFLVNSLVGDPNHPIVIPDGQSAGVNPVDDPCHSSSPPPPSPSPPAPPPPSSPPLLPFSLLKIPSSPFAAPGQNPDAKWLEAVYHDLLNRSLDPSGLSFWGGQLATGVPRYDVVLEIESSPAYLDTLVTSAYQSYLGRAVASSELGNWTSQLQSGLSDEQFEANILGSPEFLSHAGGSQSAFLNGLYEVLLGRPADSSAAQDFQGLTNQHVASFLLSSHEYRSDLVSSWFLRFLRKPPDSAGLNGFVNLLGAGQTDEQAIAAMLTSPAYFHEFTPPTLASLAISGNGSISLSLAHAGTLTVEVFRVLKSGTPVLLVPVVQRGLAADPAGAKVKLPKLRRIGLVNFGRQRKGHHTLHWNRRVRGRRLGKGNYELVLQVRRGGKLVDVSDATAFTVR